ncbi:hypothetical protein AKO1_007655 [Acrasis kona]|uniref:Uncharacterized protein n=1 Tax=Acrasis kona TaxID=1008807 RepID=A0AAW2YQ40_9EUKA
MYMNNNMNNMNHSHRNTYPAPQHNNNYPQPYYQVNNYNTFFDLLYPPQRQPAPPVIPPASSVAPRFTLPNNNNPYVKYSSGKEDDEDEEDEEEEEEEEEEEDYDGFNGHFNAYDEFDEEDEDEDDIDEDSDFSQFVNSSIDVETFQTTIRSATNRTGYERTLTLEQINRLPPELKQQYTSGTFDPQVFRDFVLMNKLLLPSDSEKDPIYAEFMSSLGTNFVEDKVMKCVKIIKKYAVACNDLNHILLDNMNPMPFAPPQIVLDDDDDEDDVILIDEREGKLNELDVTIREIRNSIGRFKSSELVMKLLKNVCDRSYRNVKV